MPTEEQLDVLREQMVEEQLRPRGIRDERLLKAMRKVPRHAFVPESLAHLAYGDGPLPIGQGQTISQPFIVAAMTQMLALKGTERILEIGTGCGYQTAVLCELAGFVYSLERLEPLAEKASHTLERLGYENLEIHVGDGSQGLPDMRPFDAIIVTAASPTIPGPLSSQLNHYGGRMVLPVGSQKHQRLYIVYRQGNRTRVEESIPVRFVPMLGKYGFEQQDSNDDDDDE